MQAGFRFQNTSGTPAVSHIDRILVSNNWVESTNPSTAGVLIGGTAGVHQSYKMMITGNWFSGPGNALSSVDDLGSDTGKYVIIKNNVIGGAPADDVCLYSTALVIRDNVALKATWPRYGNIYSANIDGQAIAAGATYAGTVGGIGYLVGDSVEIIRGATTAPGLIIWGVVTATDTIVTYAYNPTAGVLNTGTGTKMISYRPILP